MGPLNLAVQLRGFAVDAGMAAALIFDVPVEFCLKLMAVIGSNFLDAERALFDDVIDKVDRVSLRMFVVDLSALTRVASSMAPR